MEVFKSVFNKIWKCIFGITIQVWAAVMLYLYTTRSSDPSYCGYFSIFDDLRKERFFLMIMNIPCLVFISRMLQKVGDRCNTALSLCAICFLGTRLFFTGFMRSFEVRDHVTSAIYLGHYAIVILAVFGMARLIIKGGMIDPIRKPCKDLYRQWPLIIVAQCYLAIFLVLLYVYQISSLLIHEKLGTESEATKAFLDFGFTWTMFFFLNLGFVGFCGPYCPVLRTETEPKGPLGAMFYAMKTQLNLVSFLSLLLTLATKVYLQKFVAHDKIHSIDIHCFLTEIWSMHNYHLIVLIPMQKVSFLLLGMSTVNHWDTCEALKNLVVVWTTKFMEFITSIYLSMVLPTIYGFIKFYILYTAAYLVYYHANEAELIRNVKDPLEYGNNFYLFVLTYPVLFVLYPVSIVEVATHIKI